MLEAHEPTSKGFRWYYADMLEAKKSLGQHFLTNPTVLEKMIKAGEVEEGDLVLEIGPGTGVLTKALLETGARVIAIEADGRAIPILEETFSAEINTKQLTLIHADIRTFDIETLKLSNGNYKVIANIPYYISGMLFEKMLTASAQPSDLVFLVQKEVAERAVADRGKGGKESLLSLSIKIFGTPKYIAKVPKGNFQPVPKVDSAVLAISNISRKKLQDITEEDFFTVLKTGFKARRKQLLGNLTDLAPRERLESIFSTLNLPLNVRGEDMSIETWIKVTKSIFPHKK